MRVIIVKDEADMGRRAADLICEDMLRHANPVLGLATGSTPLALYQELIQRNGAGEVDFSTCITFNLDEYVGLPPDREQSYRSFMDRELFDRININKKNTYVPNGMAEDVEAHCRQYETMMADVGGIDYQVLGIGANGHIGFNEPGSSLGSLTRIKTLTKKTRQDNARFFGGIEEVPKYAITMGIGTILNAARVILLATGANKANAVAKALEGPVTSVCPASALQLHQWATFVIDEAAARNLTLDTYEG